MDCSHIFDLFNELRDSISVTQREILNELQNQLVYYISHQTRKQYLNSQFNANLMKLDSDGALMVVDYKMRILPKRSRETKQDFFGKRGWTLHSVLLFKQSENSKEIENRHSVSTSGCLRYHVRVTW